MGKREKKQEKTRDQMIDAAIEEVMEAADTHEYGGAEVPKQDSVVFFEGIVSACKVRIEALHEEIENEEDRSEDDDG